MFWTFPAGLSFQRIFPWLPLLLSGYRIWRSSLYLTPPSCSGHRAFWNSDQTIRSSAGGAEKIQGAAPSLLSEKFFSDGIHPPVRPGKGSGPSRNQKQNTGMQRQKRARIAL